MPSLTPPSLSPPGSATLQGQASNQPKLPISLVVTDGMSDAAPAPGASARSVKFGACLVDADNKPLASSAGISVQAIGAATGMNLNLSPVLAGAMKTVQGPLGPVSVGGAQGSSCFEAQASLPLCAPKQTVMFVAMLPANLGGGTAKAQTDFNPSPIALSYPPANNANRLRVDTGNHWFQVVENAPCTEPLSATLRIGSHSVPMKASTVPGNKLTLSATDFMLPNDLAGKSLPVSIQVAPHPHYAPGAPPSGSVFVERIRLATVSFSLPPVATVGQPISASGSLKAEGGKPFPVQGLQVVLPSEGGMTLCTTNVGPSGDFTCSFTYNGPPSKALVTGPEKKRFNLKLPDHVEPVTTTADVVMLGADGSLQASAPTSLLQAVMADARPGGVLLNNYAGGESAMQAYLPNGSWVFPTQNLTQGDKFDIPPSAVSPYHYYVDRVFVRVADWKLAPPNHIHVALAVEGWQGTGKRLKGRCFPVTMADQALCAVGTDSAAPDVTINNLSGQFRIALLVEGGKLVAKVDDVSAVSLDFSCGGVAAPVCLAARPMLNNQLNQQLKARLVGMKFVQEVQSVGDKLKSQFGFNQLTKFAVGADGGLILFGKP